MGVFIKVLSFRAQFQPKCHLPIKAVSVNGYIAKIVIDENTISYDFNRIKEVKTDGDVPRTGITNPGKGKGEKVSEHKNSETKEKK